VAEREQNVFGSVLHASHTRRIERINHFNQSQQTRIKPGIESGELQQ
jgi:hypothetical protein